jgi:heme oxygenase-like protein
MSVEPMDLDHRSNSATLRFKIELARPRLLIASDELWSHEAIAAHFDQYLLALYGAVRATVPLMEKALERCRGMAADPLATRLAPYFERHIEEERGHDAWLREDMRHVGLSEEAIAGSLPSPEVATLVGSQYYWILHEHPVALLGAFAVLEGYPADPQALDELALRGVPRAALRTFYKHAMIDVHHRRELDEALDGLPLLPQHERLIGLVALDTIEKLSSVLESIVHTGAFSTVTH